MKVNDEMPKEYEAMNEMLSVALRFNLGGSLEAELKMLDALDNYLYVIKRELSDRIEGMKSTKAANE